MRHKLIIISLILTKSISFGQENSSLNQYLSKLYNGFPIKKNLDDSESKYLKTFKFEESKNMYDPSKIDFKKSLNTHLPLKYQPISVQIEHFYAYDWGGGATNSVITALTLDYGTSYKRNSEKQLKRIVKRIAQETAKSIKYDIYSDAEKAGYGYQFFQNKNDTIPFLTTDIIFNDCTGESNYIFIAYIREIKN